MLQCWKEDPQERPTFSQLVVDLSAELTEMANYLDLKEMDATAEASGNEAKEIDHIALNEEMPIN